jgi:hypothetical protein
MSQERRSLPFLPREGICGLRCLSTVTRYSVPVLSPYRCAQRRHFRTAETFRPMPTAMCEYGYRVEPTGGRSFGPAILKSGEPFVIQNQFVFRAYATRCSPCTLQVRPGPYLSINTQGGTNSAPRCGISNRFLIFLSLDSMKSDVFLPSQETTPGPTVNEVQKGLK